MASRMTNKVVLVMGAGSCGPGIGNGRASAMLYALEGAAVVVCVDIDLASAQQTVTMIEAKGQAGGKPGECRAIALQGDVTDAARVEAIVARRWNSAARLCW